MAAMVHVQSGAEHVISLLWSAWRVAECVLVWPCAYAALQSSIQGDISL